MEAVGQDTSSETTADITVTTTEEITTTTEATEQSYPLEEFNFEGETFTILCRTDLEDEIHKEQETGDVYGDAIFQRNRAVEERLKIKLKHMAIPGDWANNDSFLTQVSNTIMSGDDEYQLIVGYMNYMPGSVTKGLYLDINTLPTIEPENPWWIQGYNDNVTINGKMYMAMGDLCSTMLRNAYCAYVNVDLLTQFGHNKEELYQAVDEGKWTFDMLIGIAENVKSDLNGDGKMDISDLHGISMHDVTMRSLTNAFAIDYTTRNAEGLPEIALNSERFLNAYQKVHAAATSDYWYPVYSHAKFVDGNTLFFFHCLFTSSYMRDMKSDYAVLPMPKYDEAQEKYRTETRDVTSILVVPNTVKNLELCGAAMESLNYESYQTVTPAYFDTVLQLKQVRDEGSQRMMDIIRETIYYDFGYALAGSIGSDIQSMMGYAITTPNITSLLKGNSVVWTKKLDLLLDYFAK